MARGAGASRVGERAAEGLIAKAAKDVLRDAVGPGAEQVARDGATRVPGVALSDAERQAARDALSSSRGAWNSSRADLEREFPELSRDINPRVGTARPEYLNNCQSCVVAVDRSLSGVPTEALPRTPTRDGRGFVSDPRFDWPSSVESQIGGGNRVHHVGGYDDIAHEMLQAGDGARGVVHGMRLGPNGEYLSGHVFNVVNKDGVLHFIDGQVNGYWRHEVFGRYEFIRTV